MPQAHARVLGASLSARKTLRLLGLCGDRLFAGIQFLDTSRFATQSAEEIELRATHAAGAHDIDLVDNAGVHREDTLHAVSEAHLADGKAGLRAGGLLDHDAFERLYAFLVAFLDLYVYADGVAGIELRQIGALRPGIQSLDNR